ncbi:hypothetical protein KAI46_00360 [bacterium]|nr:hypothetical protein [bacterium]
MIKLKGCMVLLLFFFFFLLITSGCMGVPVEEDNTPVSDSATASKAGDSQEDSDSITGNFKNAWTNPPPVEDPKPSSESGKKADRGRMLPSDTDEFISGWTFE